ncbi:hypothetical protein QJQ45_029311 [Haematococcus lacustris]|nr:hypothetical protein QJQ45_029311 [Haematococcus lacustris]
MGSAPAVSAHQCMPASHVSCTCQMTSLGPKTGYPQQAKSTSGWWLDRDTNACFNFQRIGESTQRPLELCSWKDREALPPVGKEYQQGYKRVNDRLPKRSQWDHGSGQLVADQLDWWKLTKGQVKHASGLNNARPLQRLAPIKPHLQHLAAASSAGTSLVANLKRITVTLATGDAVWEVYLDPIEEDMAEVSMERHGRAKQLVFFFGAAGIGTGGRWGADAVFRACCKMRIGESRWRPLELCWWLKQTPRPAKGKEYPGLDYKRLRDKPPKARQQQQQQLPAVAQQSTGNGVRASLSKTFGHAQDVSAPQANLFRFSCPLSSLQPGKAEVTRVLLNVGKIPFEDYTISREQWAELKPTMPYGQVPVLEVDGKQLAQSSAIERYAARLAGLYPEDAPALLVGCRWEAAKVDELACFMSEWLDDFVRTFYIKDADEKLAARKAIVEGALQTKMTKLNALLTEAGPDGYLVGGRMTYADVAVYVMTSNIICGFLDGVPRDLYQPFPAIIAFHTRMASVPQIRDMYQGPGKAELTRVLLNVGNVPFEDYTISREQWAELKPTMPYGQIPVLEVDGKQLAQSSAIERYAARLAGLYPQDAWEAAKVDELACFMKEWWEPFASTFSIKDADERLAARKAVAQGPLQSKIAKLNALLTEAGQDGYLVGGRMTYADVAAFVVMSFLGSGMFDGVPRDLYQPFPAITAFHTRMASVPQIRDMYQGPRAARSMRGMVAAGDACPLSSLQPGRAELTRVLLNAGNIPFDDYIISREQWAELKPTMPYGQVPVLEVDGKQLAQSSAIERYAARLAGLYPQNAWEAAKVDELACFMQEWWELFISNFSIKDVDEKAVAHKAVAEGPLQAKIGKLNTLLWQALGVPSHAAGASWWHPCLVHSDLASALTALVPLAAGVPRDLYQRFPAIIDFHTRMANVPQIRDMYQGVTEGVRMAFKAGCVGGVA